MGKKEILRRLAALEDAVGISEEIEFADGSKMKIDNRVEDKNARVGDVCKFWDSDSRDYVIGVMTGYSPSLFVIPATYYCNGLRFLNAIRLNKSEVVKLLFGKEIGG